MTIRTLPGRQFGPETILVTGAAGRHAQIGMLSTAPKHRVDEATT